ncbi:GNAT family N-acetyltransferase [Alkalihalobacillus sp. LMS39]|uniref:GNAT family N-acetyltransferase n=1 Tax=Alkalihalobacillus sp. LMS39 TaxID=2924032 RepID=UPI001FB41BB3|nr:GNAT family N-acetyltransferase [Alkalihalobacillus sp. LMS39]UOE93124.1 GNAT family N-acetyltransferase [Alkalihalobacillus sp. LMS39]
MNVVVVKDEEQLQDAYHIRTVVFVEEQKVPIEEEIDQYEQEATHFVMYDQNQPVGAGRLRHVDGMAKIERICILPNYRKTGAGKVLMEKIEEVAKELHVTEAKLNAQIQAEGFYKKLGYLTVSGQFLDAGIPHVTMKKTLT